ncbi:MAG: DUF559 domain-containing protein [Anaerolineales bacterium]|nr:DUF559 domain-containing protein [Anaerolineales bacterium]
MKREELDQEQTNFLKSKIYKVLRFRNHRECRRECVK